MADYQPIQDEPNGALDDETRLFAKQSDDSLEWVLPSSFEGEDGADGVGVPAGGTTGQQLVKTDEVDYNTEWADPPDADDIDDSATTNKFATAAQLSAIATNTSDIGDLETALDAQSLPTGGTADQILVKTDGTDYNAEWSDFDADSIDDSTSTNKFATAAELAAIATNTSNLDDLSDDVAAQVPPAGGDDGQVLTKASGTDYDYAWETPSGGGGGGGGDLLASNNLSDLDNAGTARDNLGLGTAATAASSAFQASDADLTALAAAGNSAVLAATTASFLTADETKLDGIEALADVTDATNVAAAGALMDSDLLDEDDMSSDSATRPVSQQSLVAYVEDSIDGKVNLSGDTMTGNLVIDTDFPAIQLRSDTAGGIIFEDSDEDRRASLEMNVTNDELSMQVYDSTGTFLRSLWWQDTADGILWLDENTEVRTVEITGASDDAAVPHKGYVDDEIAALKATLYCSVNHGATAGTARPTGYAGVIWYGSVQPTNATGVDIVIRTDEAVTP